MIIVSLLSNHLLGYLKHGNNLPKLMQRFHGSVAKLVNDRRSERLQSFWTDAGRQNYFDGCIRDELQFRRAYRYTLTQCSRHRICLNPADYPDTWVVVDVERVTKRALELKAFMSGVRYKRYDG